jgi:hypothetical protein
VSQLDLLRYDVVLTTYNVVEFEYRRVLNAAKIKCQYCARSFLPRTLENHNRYFCGPNSKRTEKLQKRDRNSDTENEARKKAMKTLHIGKNDKSSDIGSDSDFDTQDTGRNENKIKKVAGRKRKAEVVDDSATETENDENSDRAPGCCPSGHSLAAYTTTNTKVSCDKCSSNQKKGRKMLGCRICNWDLCASCGAEEAQAVTGEIDSTFSKKGGKLSIGSKRPQTAAAPKAPTVVRKHSVPTPSNIYRELMAEANRPAAPMYMNAADAQNLSLSQRSASAPVHSNVAPRKSTDSLKVSAANPDQKVIKTSSSTNPSEDGCKVCGKDDEEGSNNPILLCDGCDAQYHIFCVKLEAVPPEDWFCISCLSARGARMLHDSSVSIVEVPVKKAYEKPVTSAPSSKRVTPLPTATPSPPSAKKDQTLEISPISSSSQRSSLRLQSKPKIAYEEDKLEKAITPTFISISSGSEFSPSEELNESENSDFQEPSAMQARKKSEVAIKVSDNYYEVDTVSKPEKVKNKKVLSKKSVTHTFGNLEANKAGSRAKGSSAKKKAKKASSISSSSEELSDDMSDPASPSKPHGKMKAKPNQPTKRGKKAGKSNNAEKKSLNKSSGKKPKKNNGKVTAGEDMSATQLSRLSSMEEGSENALGPEDLTWEGVDVKGSMLHKLRWDRIILDEAHKIKARTSNTAKAVYSLQSLNKWCLSGTPLQNRIGELYSLVRFLRVAPYSYYFCSHKDKKTKTQCDCKSLAWNFGPMSDKCESCGHPPMQHFSYFNKHIVNPIKRYGYVGDGKKAMYNLRKEVLTPLMLRRTKAERAADLNLPQLTVEVRRLELDEKERDFYSCIYKQSAAKFNTYVDKGTLLHNFAHIFELLSRLRQAVDHPYLVIHGDYKKQDPSGKPVAPIPSRSGLKGCKDVCGICRNDIDGEVSVSACRHTFHKTCMLDYEEPTCPMCFTELEVAVDLRGIPEAPSASTISSVPRKEGSEDGKKPKQRKRTITELEEGDQDEPQDSKMPSEEKALEGVLSAVAAQSQSPSKSVHQEEDEDVEGKAADQLCIVCASNMRDALLFPCGHMYTCLACTKLLATRHCPVCRSKITKVMRFTQNFPGNCTTQEFLDEFEGADSAAAASKLPEAAATSPKPASRPVKFTIGRKSILQRITLSEFASSSKLDGLVSKCTFNLISNVTQQPCSTTLCDSQKNIICVLVGVGAP